MNKAKRAFRLRLAAAGFLFSFLLISGSGIPGVEAQDSSSVLRKLDPRLHSFYLGDEATPVLKPLPGYRAESLGTGTLPVIIESAGGIPEISSLGAVVAANTGRIITAEVPIRALYALLSLPLVRYVHSVSIHRPLLDEVAPSIRLDDLRQSNSSLTGEGVLIGIYDTGIDWRHEDFLDDSGKTRIRYLWDQTSSTGPSPSYGYGREYTRADIDKELAGTTSGNIRQKDSYGHGTHVASIAGGDGSATGNGETAGRFIGIAPKAGFIIVKGGDSTFSSNREIDGLDYMSERAKFLRMPIVMNLSLGGHEGAHDGTDPPERAIDDLSGAGSIIVVAAGNDGNKDIHFGHLFSSASSVEIEVSVPAYIRNPGTDGTYNDYFSIDAWYTGSAPPTVSIISPQGQTLGPVSPIPGPLGQKSGKGADGEISVSNQPGLTGSDYNIIINITDYATNPNAEVAPRAGIWRIIFNNSSGGRLDGWLHDSSMDAVLESASSSREMLVAIPGTARKAITVGAYKSKTQWTGFDGNPRNSDNTAIGDLAVFSSPGPSRDNREKPEITAPGQEVTAAKSEDYSVNSAYIDPDGKHVTLRGTSMAAPVVAGAIALMLQEDPSLTPETIRQLLKNGAKRDSYTGFFAWNQNWGYGKLDAKSTLEQIVSGIDDRPPGTVLPGEYALFQNYPNPFNAGTMVRYTIPRGGRVALTIFSLAGLKIRELNRAEQPAGTYAVFWDGRNDAGQAVASNIYLLRMESGDFRKTIKLAFVK